MQRMFILETRGLKKQYGEGEAAVEAVKGIDLQVEPGEFVAIMGRSGSGKSTLLAMLGGVEVPSSGQVLIENRDLATMNDDERTLMRRRRIGFIFQAFNLLPILSAEENISLPLELDGVSSSEARQRAIAALEKVGMSKRRDHVPSKMSGGEQQRVAIARALVIEPALLLADEPTGNLDSTNSQRITTLLRELVDQQKQTIVMVTHDPAVAELADRIIYVVDGLVQHSPPSEWSKPAPVKAKRGK
jgi:putative ABC transport system ATP-binding protein